MVYTSEAIERVVEQFSSLPSIGRKTAQRLTFYLLKQPKEHVQKFADSLVSLKENVSFCSVCFNYTEQDPCPLCKSEKRNRTLILVVEEPNDIVAIEKTNEYFGLYHVLHGVLNPLDGIGPEELKIKELMARVQGIEEIILALNPSVEGEVTTQYLAKMLKPFEIKVTRIASGIPMGSALEFSDEATLSRALEGRIII